VCSEMISDMDGMPQPYGCVQYGRSDGKPAISASFVTRQCD
jgi:hypothetical protein